MKNYPLTYNEFKDGLKKGDLLGLECIDCGSVITPPSGVCPDCAGSNLKKKVLKNKGKIRTFTVIRVAPEGFDPPYVVAMAELEEGPWVLGNIDGVEPDQVDMSVIGREVQVGYRLFPLPLDACGVEGVALTFTLI